jgi:hypothetical protein
LLGEGVGGAASAGRARGSHFQIDERFDDRDAPAAAGSGAADLADLVE